MSLSEIRVNTTKTRTGVGTITYTETGPVITGIATASNFKTGSTNVHSTGVELTNINTGGATATFGGAISGTSATLSGALSGTTASFSGTVSIGGTLTYEDVTNIDSVGILTARAGIIDSTLTAGRVVYVDSDKSLTDSANLTFDGSTLLQFNGTTDPKIRLQSAESGSKRLDLWIDGGDAIGYIAADQSASQLAFRTAGTERLRINSTGKVGIATDNPYAPLSLRTDPAASNAGNLADKGILLHAPGATDEQIIPISASFVTNAHLPRCAIGFISHPTADPIQGYAGEIGFYTRDGADGSAVNPTDERMRITRSGRVGIGSEIPAHQLDVVGNARVHNADPALYLQSTANASNTCLIRMGDTGSFQRASISYDLNSGFMMWKLGGAGNNVEHMRYDGANNRLHIGKRNGNQNATHWGTSRVNIVGPDPIATGVSKAGSYLAIGNNESEINGVYPITFGYTNNSNTHQPAYIAYKTTNASSAECGALLFGTRNVVTDTQPTERLRIAADGTVTIGDGNETATAYNANLLVDGGGGSRITIVGSTSGWGMLSFADASTNSATQNAGFIYMDHVSSNDNGPRLALGTDNQTKVIVRSPGSQRGQLEIVGNFNEESTPALEINDNSDARKVYMTNNSGDMSIWTRNASRIGGRLKMNEGGYMYYYMQDPSNSAAQHKTFQTAAYKVASGSTRASTTTTTQYAMPGGTGGNEGYHDGKTYFETSGANNDHYQPVAFVPMGYNLDNSTFGGQWFGEAWINNGGSQNPTNSGYNGFNSWATMTMKISWDAAHWNAKPNYFAVNHYINHGRAQVGRIETCGSQSQFIIWVLPGHYYVSYRAYRGISVHTATSAGGSIQARNGSNFHTYSSLAYSSRTSAFDSSFEYGTNGQNCVAA